MRANTSTWNGWQRVATAAALAVFVLALIGLRGEIASAGGTAQTSRSAKVGISDFVFHPAKMTVDVGSKVAFSNSDGVTHTATGKGFDTGNIKPGKSVSVTFSKKGTFAYHCTIHPSMHGKIVVQ